MSINTKPKLGVHKIGIRIHNFLSYSSTIMSTSSGTTSKTEANNGEY